MAAKAHAILSASSSDRWLHCPPSARLCETYEDKGSDYAAEGTNEYKAERKILLKNLSGNSSWKNGAAEKGVTACE